MAIKDVFNNNTDNYIKTGLSPCVDSNPSNIFQLLPKEEIGVTAGSVILQSMNLSDIQAEITSWEQNKKVLAPGEVTYVAGLTKELDIRTQVFDIGYNILEPSLYYTGLSISIDHISNFKSVTETIDASGVPDDGKSVINDINIKLSNKNINVTASIDVSTLTFKGTNAGYDYQINSVNVDNYEPSAGITSFVIAVEDVSSSIPYAKYINGAMLGIVLKSIYPDEESTYDKWLYINSVNNDFTYYDYDTSTYLTKRIDVGSGSASTATTISAGDYLNYITEHDMWKKVGYMLIQLNTFDADDSLVKNLVPGFYLFNPHTFSVEVNYMMVY